MAEKTKKEPENSVQDGQPVVIENNNQQAEAVESPATTEVESSPEENYAPLEQDGPVKLIVVAKFRDKNNRKTEYAVGQQIEFDADRASDVIARGLAKKA